MARNGSPMALSPSPVAQPMSKRDKRRNQITDRLSEMVSTFSKDQPAHYRAQLQALQVDMTMIIRADPYESAPLDDSADAISHQVESFPSNGLVVGSPAHQDYLALAGRRYHEYVQNINQAMEQRDADLVALKNKFDSASAELERSTTYKMQVAQREHLELASTIRQRLLNSVTKKRERLLREKEQLDIADSNSLFLHPSQFSINIPGSPGGVHSNRKTRHTRHRLGEPEDAPVERGRKRKIAAEDDGNDSSAPPFRPASAPYHDARAKTLYTQYEAPAYSVERLFTDKELTHATTVAQFATHNFFHHQQPLSQGAANGSLVNGHDTAVPSLDGSVDAAIAATIITADGEDQALAATSNGSPPPSQLAAQDMERTVSYHATRHATKANPLSFLSEAAAAVSSTPALVNPFIPALVPITKTDKGAPTPPAINGLDVDNDLALMLQGDTNDTSMNGAASTSTYEDDNAARNEHNINAVRGRFLEQALRDPISTQPFRLPLLETGPAAIQGGVNRPAHFGFADPASMPNGLRNGVTTAVASTSTGLGSLAAALGGVAGGLPMSRATSMAGSEIGAPSEPGGVGVGGAGMRRVRSRLI